MTGNRSNLSQAAILARMAATRAELLAANHVTALVARARRGTSSVNVQQGPIFLQTPYAGLIAAALVASALLGPRQLVRAAARQGLLPWMVSSTKAILNR